MLLTLLEAKQYLEITTDSKDDLLNALILSVTDFIKNTALNRNLESTTYKQLYDGNGLAELMLDEFPIISVTKLSQDLDNAEKEYGTLYGTAEFYIGKGGFVELFQDAFTPGQRSVYIEYVAGYTTIPGDIKDVCKQLIAKRMQDVEGKRFGITTKNVYNESVSFEITDLTPGMKKVLAAHKKRPSDKGVDVTGWSAA